MPVAYNFKKGADLPSWQWLAPFPQGVSYHGSSNTYDGVRYMYWVIQYGSPSAASSTQVWRYDTWNNGWQYLFTPAVGFSGMDIEYDRNRNCLYVTLGNATTTFYVFNLGTTAITVFNQVCNPWTAVATTVVLPATGTTGASLTMPDDGNVPTSVDSGTIGTGVTTTNMTDTSSGAGSFGPGLVGLQVRFLTGALTGQHRTITAVPTPNTLTVNAFGAAPAVGDTYTVQVPQGTLTTGSTTVPADTNDAWVVNQYANSDIVMLTGAAAGQRRRIASNTASVITLAAAVTGNPRTGPFSVAPVAGDTYQILPSSDFLYYQPGGVSTALYRIDVVATTGTAWVALAVSPAGIGTGSNTVYPSDYAPYTIIALRGTVTATVYLYDIGLNSWRTVTTYTGSETFTTGNAAIMIRGKRKLFIQKEATTRCYNLDLTTGILEPAGTMPYAVPVAYDGHRARYVKSADGVEWMYLLRAGGQEFFRVPLEWLT